MLFIGSPSPRIQDAHSYSLTERLLCESASLRLGSNSMQPSTTRGVERVERVESRVHLAHDGLNSGGM